MEIDDDPTTSVREQRFRRLVDEQLPRLRRLNPRWSGEEILDRAESMAECGSRRRDRLAPFPSGKPGTPRTLQRASASVALGRTADRRCSTRGHALRGGPSPEKA